MKRLPLPLMMIALCLMGCQMPEPIRVMSFNIRYANTTDGDNSWSHRRDMVTGVILEEAPDIIGVQEALAEQIVELQAALEDYDYVGVGRDDGHSAGEFVPIFYNKRRFTLVRGGHMWLSEKPRVPGSKSWDSSLPRMATWVRLRFKESPQNEISVINTHFDHAGEQARLESARLIRNLVESLGGHPVVVLGDFNCPPGSPPYRKLTEDQSDMNELFDPFAKRDAEGEIGTYHGFDGTPDTGRIDWILHNRRFEALDTGIILRDFNGRYPSDHFPVTATLRLLAASRWGVM
ncbi:MAG: endonuclease/exonuclease/phosphatase family protein [Phycisphaerae bacterium]|nr:endonuclease/exonuclease/phosphatase family protein [Phycisphaerae bacterium]